MLDVIGFTYEASILFFEIFSIISDNGGRDTIPTKNMVKNEFGYLYASDLGKRNCFHPLTQAFSGSYDEGVTIK